MYWCDKHQWQLAFSLQAGKEFFACNSPVSYRAHTLPATSLAFYFASNAENVVDVVIRGRHHGNQRGLLFSSLCKQRKRERERIWRGRTLCAHQQVFVAAVRWCWLLPAVRPNDQVQGAGCTVHCTALDCDRLLLLLLSIFRRQRKLC